MGRREWQAAVHEATKSRTPLGAWAHTHTQPQQTDAAGAQYMPNKWQFPIRLSRGLIPCLHFWELYAFFKLCTKNNSNSSQSSLKLFLSLDICTVNIHGWFVYPRRSLFYHNIPLYYFTVYKMFLFFFSPKPLEFILRGEHGVSMTTENEVKIRKEWVFKDISGCHD